MGSVTKKVMDVQNEGMNEEGDISHDQFSLKPVKEKSELLGSYLTDPDHPYSIRNSKDGATVCWSRIFKFLASSNFQTY
jgi:hypothetical protein